MNWIEVITSVERRRRWSRAEKERWVSALMEPGAVAAEVARKAGVDTSLLYPRKHLSGWAGVMQADAFAGYNELYDARRHPGPIYEAACWAHARRKFFELAKSAKAPIAIEAVRRIDELFEIERAINGKAPFQKAVIIGCIRFILRLATLPERKTPGGGFEESRHPAVLSGV